MIHAASRRSIVALLCLGGVACSYSHIRAGPDNVWRDDHGFEKRKTTVSDVGRTHYTAVLEKWRAPVFLGGAAGGGFAMLHERIEFDKSGVLLEVLDGNKDLRTGGGVHLASSGGSSFFGGRDYGSGAFVFQWGMRGLNPLPILLNERWSRVEVGQDGIELFDTPRDAGQHTLARSAPPVEAGK